MFLTRIEHGNLAANIWHVVQRAPVTRAQVDAYHDEYRRLHAAYERNGAADRAQRAVAESKHVRRATRAAWLKRRLAYLGPEVVEAWRKGTEPMSFEESCARFHAADRTTPGVFVVPASVPAKRQITITILIGRGLLLSQTHVYGTSANQADAINHAVAFYRTLVYGRERREVLIGRARAS
jgi:hypothetical protein